MFKVLAVAVALLASATALGASSPPAGRQGTVWVVNRALNNVAVFDGATGSVVGVVSVGTMPNSVVVAPGTHKAYVTNETSNTVSVISTMTREVVATIPVPLDPHHIRTSRDGRRVYVSEFATNRIAIIDTGTDKVIAEVDATSNPSARTHSVWITRDRKTLWAASEVTNEVSAIDVATGKLLFEISVPNRPSEVLLAPGERKAYVSIRGPVNSIQRIDVASGAVDAQVPLASQPDTLQLSPDGRTLAVGLRNVPAQLAVIDTTAMTLTKVIDVAGALTMAGHNWMSANGRYSFVAFQGGAAPGVAVVDHTTNTVVSSFDYPGGGQPHGVYYDDPAATAGPAVTVGPHEVRVTRGRLAALKVTCSSETIGFCRGRVTLLGAGAPFSVNSGTAKVVRLTLVKPLHAKKTVSVKLTAVDELGTSRTTTTRIVLRG
jgi:YVTN family beta-propeller protein